MSKARELASGTPVPATVSSDELGQLDGVTAPIQTQITNTASAASSAAADASNALSVANSKTTILKGTTAQRPTGVQGDLYYDTTLDGLMQKTASAWVPLVTGTVAVEYLVIGGGGGGGATGAGGAGGFRTGNKTVPLYAGNVVTIGSGGVGGSPNGTKGGLSQFDTIVSNGGGGAHVTDASVRNGGSGAGRIHGGDAKGLGNQGGFSPVEGYDGGETNQNGYASGGGGGGAGGAGVWVGGSGANSSITGSVVTYAGGGGGGKGDQSGTGAPGGSGGGGTGGGWGYASYPAPTSGSFYGAGGGGAGYAQPYNGGNGYQGVVILKYDSSRTITAPGYTTSTVTSGAFKITTITAGTGTVSFA